MKNFPLKITLFSPFNEILTEAELSATNLFTPTEIKKALKKKFSTPATNFSCYYKNKELKEGNSLKIFEKEINKDLKSLGFAELLVYEVDPQQMPTNKKKNRRQSRSGKSGRRPYIKFQESQHSDKIFSQISSRDNSNDKLTANSRGEIASRIDRSDRLERRIKTPNSKRSHSIEPSPKSCSTMQIEKNSTEKYFTLGAPRAPGSQSLSKEQAETAMVGYKSFPIKKQEKQRRRQREEKKPHEIRFDPDISSVSQNSQAISKEDYHSQNSGQKFTHESKLELACKQFEHGLFLNSIKNFKIALREIFDLHSEEAQLKKAHIEIILGVLHQLRGELDISLEFFQKSLEIFFGALGVNSYLTGCVTSNIGSVFYEMGDLNQALEFHRSAETILQNFKEATTIRGHLEYNLGIVFLKSGQDQLALESLKKSIETMLRIYGENNLNVAENFTAIGETLRQMGINKDALDFFKKSLRICERLELEDEASLIFLLEKIGVTYVDLKDFDQAEEFLTQSNELRRENFKDHPILADNLFNLAKLELERENKLQAMIYLKESCKIYRKFCLVDEAGFEEAGMRLLQLVNVKYIKTSHTLISLLYNNSEFDSAITEIENLDAAVDQHLIEGPVSCSLLSMKVVCYYCVGDLQMAFQLALKSVEVHKTELGHNSIGTADAFFRLGLVSGELGKKEEALIFLTNSLDIAKALDRRGRRMPKFVSECQKMVSQRG